RFSLVPRLPLATISILSHLARLVFCRCVVYFNDTSSPSLFTLSLHDALPISPPTPSRAHTKKVYGTLQAREGDFNFIFNRIFKGARKSTRLNSSHVSTSYAVFCLKKKSTYPRRKLQCGD